MRIIKCDICKKRINPDTEIIRLEINKPNYNRFEICYNCGKSVIEMLKKKRLIPREKLKTR